MTEKQAGSTDDFSPALSLQSGVLRPRQLAPYDYTIEGARLGNLTGRQLQALVERLQHKSGGPLAERLMAENQLGSKAGVVNVPGRAGRR